MEQKKIPVLTEIISNKKVRSTICCSEPNAMEATLYKWPTFTTPSLHEPTWDSLCLILKLIGMNELVKMIEQYITYWKKETGIMHTIICL